MLRIRSVFSKLVGGGKVRLKAKHLAAMEPHEVFETIYDQNAWKGSESVSGTGSDSEQTAHIAAQLPRLMDRLGAKSMLDIPCGDFFWMQSVDLRSIQYIGGDIVEDLIRNNMQYANESRSFVKCNLLEDPIPNADVIFCRDCLVHFRTEHVWQALRNVASSQAKYLVTTTFVDRANDKQIETGQWRPLNLLAAPFDLPEPLELIDERCTQDNGAYPDKMLGVWSVSAIRDHIASAEKHAA